MLREYYNKTYTHDYIIGIKEKNKIYACFIKLTLQDVNFLFSSLTTSRGYKVARFTSNKTKRLFLKSHCYKLLELGTYTDFLKGRRFKVNRFGLIYRENKGEYFEYLVAKTLKVKQNKISNLSHTKGGDIRYKGVDYQIKFEGAGIYIGHR